MPTSVMGGLKLQAQILTALLLISGLGACATRAPSTHELDRRSGLSGEGSDETTYDADLRRIGIQKAQAKETGVPVRLAPLIARVWLHDQTLDGGHWLQGTWMFVEVEGSKWVKAPDASGGTLTMAVPETIPTRLEPATPKVTAPARSALSDRK